MQARTEKQFKTADKPVKAAIAKSAKATISADKLKKITVEKQAGKALEKKIAATVQTVSPVVDAKPEIEKLKAAIEKQFKVGDKAIYPTKGVTEVVSIKELDIAGKRQKFYELRLLDSASKFMVPVANAKNVGLRPPISETEIREVFEILREKTVVFDNQTWNRRYRAFKDKIRTGSVFDVAEVMRDLYLLKAEKSLSYGEKQMLEEARALIVKEIAVARKRSEDKVRAEIEKIFSTN